MKKIILLTAVFVCCLQLSYAQQPGDLDSSFGSNGIVTTDLGFKVEHKSYARQVLLQPDGSMYVLLQKSDQILIAKRHPDGSADISYGLNGYSSLANMNGVAAVVQSDSKIVVVGNLYVSFENRGQNIILTRYNTDGSLDNTFGIQAYSFSGEQQAKSVAIQSDGKIVVGGISDYTFEQFLIARFNSDGSRDHTFAGRGYHYTRFEAPAWVESVAIQDDGKILAAGVTIASEIALVRYKTDGSPDSSFSDDGKQVNAISTNSSNNFYSMVIQSDGKIIIGGLTTALVRYNVNGSLDATFNGNGIQTTDFSVSSIALQNDGKLIVAGNSDSNFIVARYNTNGSLDKSFASDGKQTTDFADNDVANSVAIAGNGKIVVAGSSGNNFALAGYTVNGSMDITFDTDGKLIEVLRLASTFYTGTAVQNDGKLVAAGYTWNGSNYDFVVSRYNTDGALDNSFSGDGSQITDFASSDDKANSIAIQGDGKIVVAGSAGGGYAIVRYNIDGSLDNTFAINGKKTIDFSINSVAIQSDGKIVVGGEALARYNTDGSPDISFDSDGKATAPFYLNDIAIHSDGKIVGIGSIRLSNLSFAIARYNSNGSVDNTFSDDGIQTTDFSDGTLTDVSSSAYSVIIQPDAKIVVAGNFQVSDKVIRTSVAIARYNSDGSLDSSFSDDGKQITGDIQLFVTSVAFQNNGKIVVAGYYGNGINFSFLLFRYYSNGNIDGSFGRSFGPQGGKITKVSDADNKILGIAIAGNKLYAVGYGQSQGDFGVVAKYSLGDEAKIPTIYLDIPDNIVKYRTPARIKLNAAVDNGEIIITKVRFYNGTTRLHTETKFPYGFLWADVREGIYTLTAKAYDDKGNVFTSNSITVSVVDENVPPVVSMVNPVNDTTYTGPAYIYLVAKAKDANDKISKVEFYNGPTLLRTEYHYPYTYWWDDVHAGIYTITAKATDDKGLSATSAPVIITVTEPGPQIFSQKLFSGNSRTDLNSALSVRLNPNPATNTLQIYTNALLQNKRLTISVISSSGIIMKTIYTNATDRIVQLDVSSLASGVYTVKVVTGDRVTHKRFVKL